MVKIRVNLCTIILWLLIALYIFHFGALSILKHEAFKTHAADLGNMDQPIWNTLHGRFVEETKDDGAQAPRLTDHFEPIFLLVSLSFLIYDNVASILIFQTVALALGALPIFWLGRDRLKSEPLGLAFAAVYLLFPALQAANLTEFHASPLAAAPLLFAFYFIEKGRYGLVWPFALLAMSAKEEISLLTFMLGLYVFFVRGRRLQGALLALVSLGWFAIATFIIIPAYSSSGSSIYVGRYASLGGSFAGIARVFFTRPWAILEMLFSLPRLSYLAGLLASAGFFPIFGPQVLALALPVFLANALSDYPAMFSGEFHYSAPIVPFFVVAAICGAEWLLERLSPFLGRKAALSILACWMLLWALGYQHLRGFTPMARNYEIPRIIAHHRLFARFSSQIPSDAKISTTPPLFPHLSHRRVIYLFPVVKDAEYVLLDVSGVTDMHPNDVYRDFLEMVEGDFGILDAADGYILLKRGIAGKELPDAFYDFARAGEVPPEYTMVIDFAPPGGKPLLRFLGFDLVDDYKWRWTKVRLYWEVLGEIPQECRLYPFFLNRAGEVIEDTEERPMVATIWYPPHRWRAGERTVVETVPWDLGEFFTLALSVVSGKDWQAQAKRWGFQVLESDYPVEPAGTWVGLLSFERRGDRLRRVGE